MKNYNRRGLITGIAEIIIAVFCIVSFFITDFDIKLSGHRPRNSLCRAGPFSAG